MSVTKIYQAINSDSFWRSQKSIKQFIETFVSVTKIYQAIKVIDIWRSQKSIKRFIETFVSVTKIYQAIYRDICVCHKNLSSNL